MRRTTLRYAALIFVAACTAIQSVSATPITVPTSLHPGDHYRLVFVTAGTRDGTSANIADYNSFVTTAADAVPELSALGTSWHAVASTSTIDARDNTGTNPTLATGVPIFRLDDTAVAMSNALFWQSNHLASISITETGAAATAPLQVWTETATTGLKLPGGLGTSDGTYRPGMLNATNLTWVAGLSANSLALSYHLYGMSDVLTVVPEPSTLALTGMGSAAAAILAWRRRRVL